MRVRRASPAMSPSASHVLLVEDDETLAGLLSVHLRARGYQVTVAGTAEDARGPPGRGPASGHRPARHQPAGRDRLVRPAQRRVRRGRPTAGVVASAMSVSPARLREFDVAGYLPKPFALDTLGASRSTACSPRRRTKRNA